MRHEMEEELKETLRYFALKLREEHGLTQAKMAEALVMSERSYEEIESGRSACGALTAVLILLSIRNRNDMIEGLFERLEKAYALETVSV